MKTFFLTAVISVFLLSTSIGIQAQNQSAINPLMDVKHLQGNPMPSMGHAYVDNIGFKANQIPQDFKNIGNLKTKKEKQFRSKMGGDQLLDSVTCETWDAANNKWLFSVKVEYIYFSNKTFHVIYFWDADSSQWWAYRDIRTYYTYDSIGNMNVSTFFVKHYPEGCWEVNFESTYDAKWNLTLYVWYTRRCNASQWVGTEKNEWTYDTNGNIILHIYYLSSGDTSWECSSKHEYSYDENGNKILEVLCDWDIATSQWIGWYKYEYVYEAYGNQTLECSYDWDAITSQWIVSYKNKYEYEYDANDSTTLKIKRDWVKNTSQWVNRNKEEYTYDINGNNTSKRFYYWDETTGKWVGQEKNEWTYDTNGNIILHIYYLSSGDTSWKCSSKHEYNYDENGNEILEVLSDYNIATSQWIANSKTTYYYSDHSITNTTRTPETQLSVYPNPAKEFIVFDLNTSREPATLIIYDIQGKKVIEQRLNESHQVSISHLTKGLYLYRLDDGKNIYTGKVIKE